MAATETVEEKTASGLGQPEWLLITTLCVLTPQYLTSQKAYNQGVGLHRENQPLEPKGRLITQGVVGVALTSTGGDIIVIGVRVFRKLEIKLLTNSFTNIL